MIYTLLCPLVHFSAFFAGGDGVLGMGAYSRLRASELTFSTYRMGAFLRDYGMFVQYFCITRCKPLQESNCIGVFDNRLRRINDTTAVLKQIFSLPKVNSSRSLIQSFQNIYKPEKIQPSNYWML